MESDYVQKVVGSALALGLAEVALRRPTDPIEYLGLWLLKHKKALKEIELMKAGGVKESTEETEEEEQTLDDEIKSSTEQQVAETQEQEILTTTTQEDNTTVLKLPGSRPGSKLSRIEEETTTET